MSDAAGSDNESAPPSAAGDAVPAAVHNAAHQHPVWRAAAGKGSGPASQNSGGGKAAAGAAAPNPGRYAPISMLALEIRQRGELDGASSVGSESGRSARERLSKRTRGAGRMREYDDVEDEDEEDEEDDEDDEEDEEGGDDAGELLAGAAFGAGGGSGSGGGKKKKKKKGGGGKKRRGDNDGGTQLSLISDTDDAASITSSAARAAHKRAFPVSGISCVGCALPAKVAVVDDFVMKNCEKMSEASLFKMAALKYKTSVAEPAEAEGVPVPAWAWKEIRAHYQLHKVDARYQRFENIRTLGAMRKTLEMQLMRENEDGELMLDKTNSEQILKIITLSSRELSLLQETNAAAARPKK